MRILRDRRKGKALHSSSTVPFHSSSALVVRANRLKEEIRCD
jgi:hypothetical protein